MNTSKNYGYSFFHSIVIGGCIVAMVLLVYAIYGAVVETVPTLSYQEQNLQVLRTAKPNDLILCIGSKEKDHSSPAVWVAILVERNDGAFLYGDTINNHQMNRIPIGGWPYEKFSTCSIEVQRDMPSGNMSAHLGRIILYGLNNPNHPIR